MDKLKQIKSIVEEYANTKGHDKCWYYPDLFNKLCKILDIPIREIEIKRKEFELGCKRYQDEIYKDDIKPDGISFI